MSVSLSIVIVVHDMARELPRTLVSWTPPYQRDVAFDDYEIIVVDNGSALPVDEAMFEAVSAPFRLIRVDPAPRSPAHAANKGIELASGNLVGLVIDGARMASPRLVASARLASRLASRPVITSPAYHLGATRHMEAGAAGYDQQVEDDLLATSGWEHDGYRLFEISTFAGSSGRGWFGPMGESSALFMPKPIWQELDTLDERFSLPGGGLVNHDLYRRACSAAGAQLVVLLGEGTFHQYHGGAATTRRFTWEEMHAEYVAIRGEDYQPPENEPLYVGRVPTTSLRHVERSAQLAIGRSAHRRAPG